MDELRKVLKKGGVDIQLLINPDKVFGGHAVCPKCGRDGADVCYVMYPVKKKMRSKLLCMECDKYLIEEVMNS